VKRFERLDEATTPDGTVLTLYRHDDAYLIWAGGIELMSTRRHHSEDKLAEVACAPLRETPSARVLIGGLGLGFTLRESLRHLPPDATVVVAEIMDAVIAWNRNPAYRLAAEPLGDPRVELRHEDVADTLRANPSAFDAIMLDVDNGADPLTTAGNARLYGAEGIRMTVAALRPGGRLAYWSAGRDPEFEESLRRAGLVVDGVRVRAHATAGGWHMVYVAQLKGEGR
jgi:spermidine synthase